MKSGKIAVFGLILAAAMVSAVTARAEVSIGGGIEGYIPSSRPRVIILPAAQPEAVKEAAAPAKAVQPVQAAVVAAESVSEVKEAGKKVAVAQAAKAGKKGRGGRRKSRIAAGALPAPKAAAVSVS